MSFTFVSPSQRASGSDLTVAISPLGLVELADEEFEVHGPRLNRYAQNWAFYLGHHWGYRREAGEPQITFNYVKAFADYINNFTFTRGVHFGCVKQYEHIIPALLKRVWEVDNSKTNVMWEMGQYGGVNGDVFVKIAWEEPWQDAVGDMHAPRVRIMPLNPAFCFPEWHPHDRERLIRFKLKYRFWATSAEGTRQVYTYTEILTDETIEEYINDELVDSRPNPLGVIPITHIANSYIAGSPWGLADIADIVSINREYNEKATDISDIINYHAAPVTIITGAKASNLEKGAKKVWGGLPKEAQVFNLENGVDLAGPMSYLEMLKRTMHEITGVPESALGQMQPISNTSGVALAIAYQPLMQRYAMKKMQYTKGLKQINDHILRTLYCFEPESLKYDPTTDGVINPETFDGPLAIDPGDPLAYVTEAEWPPPLPVDKLITLNEIQMRMQVGLESKIGALRELGEEFPADKMQEIFEEQIADAKQAGALSLVKSQIASAIVALTGIAPEGVEGPEPQEDADGNPINPPTGPNPVSTPPGGGDPFAAKTPDEVMQMMTDLVTQAYGTKFPQRRNPSEDGD
jgi:hypothetical protein